MKTKLLRLREATKNDIGKFGLVADELLDNEMARYTRVPLHNDDFDAWKYVQVLEEIERVGEPCEFTYGEEIEVLEPLSSWVKATFLAKSEEPLPYSVILNNEKSASYLHARKLTQTQPSLFEGKVLICESTGERFELRKKDD